MSFHIHYCNTHVNTQAAKNSKAEWQRRKHCSCLGILPSAVFPNRPTLPPPIVTAHPRAPSHCHTRLPPTVNTHPPPTITYTSVTGVTPTQAMYIAYKPPQLSPLHKAYPLRSSYHGCVAIAACTADSETATSKGCVRVVGQYTGSILSSCFPLPDLVLQLIQGERKCSNINVQYLGDPLLQPIRCFENMTPFLSPE